MSDMKAISSGAQGLSRNPLGIIALFIVLIYGFASLTLGINSSLDGAERLPLVWFLVCFPVVVLLLFTWLVVSHHEKLYGPGDYKSDEGFLEGIKARYGYAEEHKKHLDQLKNRIRKTITDAQGKGGTGNAEVEYLVETLSADIDTSTSITVDAKSFLSSEDAIYTFPVSAFVTFGDLLDTIFFKIQSRVGPYEYGHSWVLVDSTTGRRILGSRMIVGAAPGKAVTDIRSLSEAGIAPGVTLRVVRP